VAAGVHRLDVLRAEPLPLGRVGVVLGLLDEQPVDVDPQDDVGAVPGGYPRDDAGVATV